MKASGGSSHPLTVHSWEEGQGHPSLEMPQLAEVDGNPVILRRTKSAPEVWQGEGQMPSETPPG